MSEETFGCHGGMVSSLPPVNKKRSKKEATVQPLPPSIEQDQALISLLDSLITTDPQTTNHQPTRPTVYDKNHNLNVCPFHECSLILFESRTNGESYIKCQINQCPIFTDEDSMPNYTQAT